MSWPEAIVFTTAIIGVSVVLSVYAYFSMRDL